MPIVIDASSTLTWLFDEVDVLNRVDDLMTEDDLIAPPIWQLEVTQAVLRRERRHLITPDAGNELLKILDGLPIQTTSIKARTFSDLTSFARAHQLSAYDATYLLLAQERQARLMTHDRNLQLAAARLQVEVV